ncbi:MAG: thermonuclease family protein [Chlorobi bacterium]|nr:thermonuclease family protein [Chlorobiota bacterium]
MWRGLVILILMVACRHHRSPSALSRDSDMITGKVVGLADGDSFVIVTDDKEEIRIRMHGIDAPERRQPYWKSSRRFLSDMIYGKRVRIKVVDRDRYGRLVGVVFMGDTNVNYEMVRHGYAWHYVRYSNDTVLARLQREAKARRLGLWQEPGAVPPWEERRLRREARLDREAVP